MNCTDHMWHKRVPSGERKFAARVGALPTEFTEQFNSPDAMIEDDEEVAKVILENKVSAEIKEILLVMAVIVGERRQCLEAQI